MALVAALGTEPSQLFQSAQLSPGEAKKVAIARALALEVSALFLDEPTNDLDLPSIERLQAALEVYRGALVLVTHDHELARATTTETWLISRGIVQSGQGRSARAHQTDLGPRT